MYTAEYIAEWFLARNHEDMIEGSGDLISNLKLQKLLYYAQGCTLAITGAPLFEDDIVAWTHGPVVPSIYQKYKDYHSNGIPFDGEFDASQLDKQTASILEEVYQVFGQYSAWKLRDMTHAETPWLETERNHVISIDSIRTYFQEHYVEG